MLLTAINTTGYDTLFLDRDGVINAKRANDYVKCWEEFVFLPCVLDAFAQWKEKLKHIIIVTNQRGVGKGLMSEEDLLNIHNNMLTTIEKHGGRVDKIYYCSAVEDTDINRKPNIGMALQAKKDFSDIDFSRTLMIGDSESDSLFALCAGIDFVKI